MHIILHQAFNSTGRKESPFLITSPLSPRVQSGPVEALTKGDDHSTSSPVLFSLKHIYILSSEDSDRFYLEKKNTRQ